MLTSFQDILRHAQGRGAKTMAVAAAGDEEVLLAVSQARRLAIIKPLLFGDEERMRSLNARLGLGLAGDEMVACPDPAAACAAALAAVAEQRAQILMKGLVDTAIILKELLKPVYALTTPGRLLSHVALFEVEGYDRFLYVTDAAMNIAPDQEGKRQIVLNAAEVAHFLGNALPRVAVLSAKEKADEKMPSSVDAAALERLNATGALSGCLVQGPLALDNAVSAAAARQKGIGGAVAGQADILVPAQIDAANILYKSLVYFARAKNAGIVVGAKIPVVLTSRADSHEAKLYSIALAACLAGEVRP